MLRTGGDPDGGRAGEREGMTEHYVGSELELFSTAANWKSYFPG